MKAKVQLTAKEFSLDHDQKTILTCAWCFPGLTVLRDNMRQLAPVSHYNISHGICDTHLADMRRGLQTREAA